MVINHLQSAPGALFHLICMTLLWVVSLLTIFFQLRNQIQKKKKEKKTYTYNLHPCAFELLLSSTILKYSINNTLSLYT